MRVLSMAGSHALQLPTAGAKPLNAYAGVDGQDRARVDREKAQVRYVLLPTGKPLAPFLSVKMIYRDRSRNT
jgi:hypothetical protein